MLIILAFYSVIWAVINIYGIFPLIVYRISQKKSRRLQYNLPEKLPKITILVPAYHEANVLPICMEHIFKVDYPKKLIEVIVLVEMADLETIESAKELKKKYSIRHLRIEESELPQGKPRALNFGLLHAKGDIIGVIDAEDVIDKRLLKEVVSVINSGYDVVQGVLDMINDRSGWKNMHLRGEYTHWYRSVVPALVSAKLPVPLSGTTNFFKREVILKMKGWDPYNLTEDFDIGMRLYNSHKKVGLVFDKVKEREVGSLFKGQYSIAMMHSVTREESPISFLSWLKQRTRWQRGKIQTLKKMIRESKENGVQLRFNTIMVSFLPHAGPINLTGVLLSFYALASSFSIPSWLSVIFIFNMIMVIYYCIAQAHGYYIAVHKNRHHRLRNAIIVGVTTPIYWIMLWIADIRTMKHEYVNKKVFWEHTAHSGVHMKYTKTRKIG